MSVRRKTKSPLVPTEADETRAVCQYLELRHIAYCHVPNESVRHRSAGTKAGVPDLLIFEPVDGRPEIRGVSIEMKRIGGVVSDSQESFMLMLRSRGWETRVCYGAKAAILCIDILWPIGGGE